MTIRGLREFLRDYPGMALRPSRAGQATVIAGRFRFTANGDIADSYQLEVKIDRAFPRDLPKVVETGGKIPRNGEYHVNPDDTLCLGSPLRLRKILADSPDLITYAEKCLVPYLYHVSAKLQRGEPLVGLEHGTQGIVDDYANLFGVPATDQVLGALKLLAMKKRIANKKPCPCGCRRALGQCPLHRRLNSFRRAAPRSWFSAQAQQITKERHLLR